MAHFLDKWRDVAGFVVNRDHDADMRSRVLMLHVG
jgi:hypothetical protein